MWHGPGVGYNEIMGLPASKPRHSIQDYYRIENDATEKHEFRDGEILAMSGGSPQHAQIAANLIGEMRNQLKGKPCRLYTSDLRVRVRAQQRSMYPDASVICGPIEYDPDDKAEHTVLNPRVIVEVLSPSTEAYDRGEKFAAYRDMPSMQEYVLVSHAAARVESFFRQADGTWALASFGGADAKLTLRSLQVTISLAEIYADVEFPPPVVCPEEQIV
jgi:Uma2 family endonuclease